MKKVIFKIMLYINLAFVVGILLTYLSIYLSPDDFGITALFGLGYSVFLIGNIIFIVYWSLKKRLLFIISLIAIIIGWSHLSNFFQIHVFRSSVSNQNSFKVLSYNVRLFDRYNWTKQKGTKDKMLAFIKKSSADVFCLQEYYSNSEKGYPVTEWLTNELDAKYHYIAAPAKFGKNYHLGIATFSKYPIINHGEIRFKNTNNITIYTDIQINEKVVRFYNNHLESIHFGYKNYQFMDSLEYGFDETKINGALDIISKVILASKKRSQQVEVIYHHIKDSPYPVVVCGDFNDTPISYAYHRMRKQLNDAFVESGFGFGDTYPQWLFPFRIDFILHSKSLKSYTFERNKIAYSDHYPIECWFEFVSK